MRRAFALSLLMLTACPADYDQLITEPEDRQCPPLLPALIDFGEVEFSQRGQQTLELINPNQRTVLVVSLTRPPPPFFLEPATIRLMPGVHFPLRASFVAPDPRQHFGTITFHRGEGCESQEVQLTGIGAGAVVADESLINFGPLALDVTATRVLHLHNTRRRDAVVELRPSAMISVPRTVTVPARSSLDVPVSVTPHAGNVIQGTVVVLSDAEGPGGMDTFVVHVFATAGRPVISIDRTDFVVERVPLDGWLMRRFWIRNTGDGPTFLDLNVVRDPDAGTPNILSGASIANLGTLAPDSGVAAFLHLRADRPGFSRETAVLQTEDPDRRFITFTVEGTGEAIGACGPNAVTVNPPSVTWQPPMFPAQMTFTFTNTNAEDCLLDSIEALNPAWHLAAGETDQALVPAGGTVTRTVDFTGPGDGLFVWNTYVPPFIQNGQVMISIAP